MGQTVPHKKVKLIIGFIFKDDAALKRAEAAISKGLGPIDFKSPIISFDYTNYYKKEFGENLKRGFMGMERLISAEDLYRVKLRTNAIERVLSRKGKRTVNIDPGYITEAKLVLLTTKDQSHRVYLGRGIYADVVLRFYKGSYVPQETAYPDYKSGTYRAIFKKIRDIYRRQLIRGSKD